MEINENTKRFIGILAKIPMFQRLLPVQALEILKICKPRSFDDRECLVEHGGKSTEMYILLSGKLVVLAPDGTTLTTLSPITSVGEMGIITNQPRTANVIATGKANVFEISKIKFEVLLKKFPDVGFVIFRNIIQTLSSRLDNTNQQLVQSQKEPELLRSGDPIAP
jgi:CRP-like cAMP-binding protein